MRHPKPLNGHSHALGVHGLLQKRAQPFCSVEKPLIGIIVQVKHEVHVLLWNQQDVPWVNGINVQERVKRFTLPHFIGWNRSLNDTAENARLHAIQKQPHSF